MGGEPLEGKTCVLSVLSLGFSSALGKACTERELGSHLNPKEGSQGLVALCAWVCGGRLCELPSVILTHPLPLPSAHPSPHHPAQTQDLQMFTSTGRLLEWKTCYRLGE